MLRFDYNNCLDAMVGKDHGISLNDIKALEDRAALIHDELQGRRGKDLGFYELPFDKDMPKAIAALAKQYAKKFENLILAGIGGSALGPTALLTALRHSFHNLLPAKARGGMRLFVLDNADPEMIASCFEALDLKKTLINVVTKSGTTPETMTGFMVIEQALAKVAGKDKVKDHLIYTTDPQKGLLRALADRQGVAALPVPQNVGGRFSVFSAVGLLPAACCGIDIKKLLAGAAAMDARCRKPAILDNPAYLYAAIHYLLDTQKKKNISVMMPYCQALRDIADWHRQLWAESLGKRFDLQGREVFVGQTPIKALGATDQHSQIQLYVEGPNDKVHTLIQTETWRKRCMIPKGALKGVAEMDIFRGRDMSELMTAELAATEYALTKNNRPNLRLILPKVSPETVGALMHMLEIATAFAGGLYNINAFDQPGVEEGKQATFALMGREGEAGEAKRKELETYQARRKRPALA